MAGRVEIDGLVFGYGRQRDKLGPGRPGELRQDRRAVSAFIASALL